MKDFALIFYFLFWQSGYLEAQTLVPQIESIKSYGGNGGEEGAVIHFSQDGYIVYANSSGSTNHDLICNTQLSTKGWLLKTDKQGNEIFSNCFGGFLRSDSITTSWEVFQDMVTTKDSGCIATCQTFSANFPLAPFPYTCQDSANGFKNLSLVKYDKNGNIQWTHCYGGGQDDGIYSIDNTSDGGYIFLAQVRSTGGDIGSHYGSILVADSWLVKIDSAGNIQWKEVLGGTGYDYANKVKEISPGRYMTSITTSSTDGNLTSVAHYSTYDEWFCIFDSAGNITSEGTVPWYGQYVAAYDFYMTSDSEFIWAGQTAGNGSTSNICDASTNNGDFAVFKMDTSFNIQWCNIQNGSHGWLYSITALPDSIFLFCGNSESTSYNSACTIDTNGLSSATAQGWMIGIDIAGRLKWRKSICGSQATGLSYGLYDTVTRSIYISGGGAAIDGDLTGVPNYGYTDEWLFKINMVDGINNIADNNPVAIFPNPTDDIFNIQVSGGSINFPYTLSDIAGRNILSGVINTGTTQVNISSLTTGLYLLKIGELNPREFKIIKD